MKQMPASYKTQSFQSKALNSPGLLFNLCCAAHDLTSCNCRTPWMGRLTTAIIMTHGICWPPVTIPSSAILAPGGCILPFSPAGTNTRKSSIQMCIKLVYFWRHWQGCYHCHRLLALCLHLVSGCCLIVFFVVVLRAVWVSTLIACWSHFQAAMGLWGS